MVALLFTGLNVDGSKLSGTKWFPENLVNVHFLD
jgi:hypothetical protein